ncbi:MAG: GNAT family N-acetyltransferase [Chlorobiaceae bacterium]|nr:GNAT family N-acetyltransferase [Chlorobiaceae bacterium]MBA4310897.1 GNAT family N-acetyltransferase [Chlorobiaceae bacterium]
MNNELKIVRATKNDIPLILSFIKKIAEYEKLSHEVIATEESLRKSLFGERANAEVVFAYQNNEPIAYAVYFFNFSTFVGKRGLYLEDIFVLPEFRKLGIGKILFTYLMQYAIDKNCGRMEWAVLDWNEPALNFYNKIGATEMTEWKMFRLTENKMKELLKESE